MCKCHFPSKILRILCTIQHNDIILFTIILLSLLHWDFFAWVLETVQQFLCFICAKTYDQRSHPDLKFNSPWWWLLHYRILHTPNTQISHPHAVFAPYDNKAMMNLVYWKMIPAYVERVITAKYKSDSCQYSTICESCGEIEWTDLSFCINVLFFLDKMEKGECCREGSYTHGFSCGRN